MDDGHVVTLVLLPSVFVVLICSSEEGAARSLELILPDPRPDANAICQAKLIMDELKVSDGWQGPIT